MNINFFRGKCQFDEKPEKEKLYQAEAQKEMLMHLHEQFAINHNQNLGSLITLFVAMLGVLWAYGSVLLGVDMFNTDIICYEGRLLIVTQFADIILTILIIINAYQGFHERKDQFVTHNIRIYYNLHELKQNNGNYTINYTPMGKKNLDIFPGLYGLFIHILIWIFIFINMVTFLIVKAIFSDYVYKNSLIDLLLIFFFICSSIFIYAIIKYIREYHKIEKDNKLIILNNKYTN